RRPMRGRWPRSRWHSTLRECHEVQDAANPYLYEDAVLHKDAVVPAFFSKKKRPIATTVKPDTVVHWRRSAFARYWTWKSRRRPGRPAVAVSIRDLIRRMSRACRLWGAPRIHGELLKLGNRSGAIDCR